MNHSPNILGDIIRINNSDLSSFNIVTINGRNYITESSLYNFAEENRIEDVSMLLKSIAEFNNIKDLNTMTNTSNNHELNQICEIISLFESIDPREVVKVANGKNLFKMYINQLVAFVTNREYNKANDIKKYIKHCDKVLADIEEEKKKCREKEAKNSSYKFSMMYIFNIAFTLFEIFIAPKIISNMNIQWPSAIKKLFIKNSTKVVAGKTVSVFGKHIKKSSIIKGMTVAVTVPDDLSGLYLSFTDYEKLLTEYEIQIKKCRNDLNSQLKNIEKSEKEGTNNMFTLREDYTDPEVSSVEYQYPSELDAGPSPTVVHDDSSAVSNPTAPTPINNIEDDIPYHHNDFDKRFDDKEHTLHHHDHDNNHECNHDNIHHCDHHHEEDFNPIKKIEVAKYNPMNITIVKYNDNFYINLNDIKAMMKIYDCDDFDDAIDKIIDAHKDSGIDSDNIKIVMSKDDLEDLDESSTNVMEESSVQFEVY